ncbi:MAG: aldo/keto reductase, partial [Polyangiaceae bacterium]
MKSRSLGKLGFDVSVLGLGCGALGDGMSEHDAEALVARALDLGVVLFDTAPSYGDSEAKLGRALSRDRNRAVLVTKGGYGVEATPDWTRECIARGVDRALLRLRTDSIDVFLLHSCPLDVLARGDLIEELGIAKSAGKIRAIGYSGDNDALAWAARESAIDVIETSLSPFDQSAFAHVEAASVRGAGVLVKRPLGNAPWRFDARPERADIATYWDRYREMNFRRYEDPSDVALRFAAFANG